MAIPSEIPDFEIAVGRLQEFLRRQSFAFSGVQWIFQEDILFVGNEIYLRHPVPAKNIGLVQQIYTHARGVGIGVSLSAVCQAEDHIFCFIKAPRSYDEAAQSMISGLKLSHTANLPTGHLVGSKALWGLYKWVDRWSARRIAVDWGIPSSASPW
jgi:hypothetical protein